MRTFRDGCCARAASGHAAAPPRTAMNARRFVLPMSIRAFPVTKHSSNEDAIALHINDLFGLRNREVDCVVPVLVRIGPDEAMLFKTVGEVFLDDPGGLILTVYLVWCRPDAIAIVFDE